MKQLEIQLKDVHSALENEIKKKEDLVYRVREGENNLRAAEDRVR